MRVLTCSVSDVSEVGYVRTRYEIVEAYVYGEVSSATLQVIRIRFVKYVII